MLKASATQIMKALKDAEIGVNKYICIMELFKSSDVSKDEEFKRQYRNFYKVRMKNDYYNLYCEYMQKNRNKEVAFEDVLKYLYEKTGRIEASFSSKLVATIDSSKPVWDKFVMKNTGIKVPSYGTRGRLEKCLHAYEELEAWYRVVLNSSEGKKLIAEFDKKYPNANISDLKKIDFVLWQIR